MALRVEASKGKSAGLWLDGPAAGQSCCRWRAVGRGLPAPLRPAKTCMCGVLDTQRRSGSAIGSGGAAVRSWQWEPQWISPVRDDSSRGMRVNTQKSARRALSSTAPTVSFLFKYCCSFLLVSLVHARLPSITQLLSFASSSLGSQVYKDTISRACLSSHARRTVIIRIAPLTTERLF